MDFWGLVPLDEVTVASADPLAPRLLDADSRFEDHTCTRKVARIPVTARDDVLQGFFQPRISDRLGAIARCERELPSSEHGSGMKLSTVAASPRASRSRPHSAPRRWPVVIRMKPREDRRETAVSTRKNA